MKYKKFNNVIVVRFDVSDEIMPSLMDIAERRKYG